MQRDELKEKPFCLNDGQIDWVENTLKDMSLDEKLGQMICPGVQMIGKKQIEEFAVKRKLGALMIRPMDQQKAAEAISALQNASKVPMLIAANLEWGGDGAVLQGTKYGMPMGCTATGDYESGYRLGKISCSEGAGVGVNWAFAPIVDIDNSYRNPITNIRAFSSKRDDVIAMASNYLKAAKEENVAVSIKHFPGDGCDERDQHLLVSVNDCSYEEWMDTYGTIYRTLIDQGAQTVMVGHIAQPAVARHFQPDISREEAFLPASQSKVLITDVLRKELGFRGLAVTDSTLMVGYMQKMPRREALAKTIMAGIDMILFNRNLDEDFVYLQEAVEKGTLTTDRIDEAVSRILATKAALGLPEKKQAGTLQPTKEQVEKIGCKQYKEWTSECADKAITLVKDNRHYLPLSPQKTKRIYLNVIENYVTNRSAFAADIKSRLEKEGFEVTLRKRKMEINQELMLKGIPTPTLLKVMKEIMATTDSFVSKYDMCMIVLNMETVSNATTVRVDWKVMFGLGNDIPWYAGEMPCVVISTANPYHLLDVPMADVYINAYTGSPVVLDALMDKVMGRSEFKGISPVDAFCGHEDTMI